jgi:hypothetical protein
VKILAKRIPQSVLTYIFDYISEGHNLTTEEIINIINEKINYYNFTKEDLKDDIEFQKIMEWLLKDK